MKTVERKSAPEPLDKVGAVEHALELIFVGVSRYARGEKISAHTFIRQWALRRLLQVLPAVIQPPDAAMLDTLSKEFIKTARSKGLPEWRVNLLHGFRVALTPVVVLIGFRLPILIGGSVIIEQVFQWPGLGNLFVLSVRNKDLPTVMTIALLSVILVLVVSLIIDVLTAIIDPRVRLGGK